jgi:hypothetical protein
MQQLAFPLDAELREAIVSKAADSREGPPEHV